ncbi:MAG: methylenetetrahydrofolate dehydrogenase (NADP+) / methenyltetrahydrofolate cyclohydrolase [Parcubacteria group bacterium Gr01-1014_17]|nr:MAG: methylenetetrahydrofolate dehydrogenase (NADP+) / methenyltetrahydrofolate cyclohydrolase [Parcubacteria group bacterium Gr01-1014_17]
MQNRAVKKLPVILDGRVVRDEIQKRLKKEFAALAHPPVLAIVQVGDDLASGAYIKQKALFGAFVGARVIHEKLPLGVNEKDVTDCIHALAANPSVFGVIVQLPLPPHLSREHILDFVPYEKDVDGLSDASGFVPATARGVYELLSHYDISVTGKKVAVFGRSLIAGGPIAQLLSAKGARVSVIHSKTPPRSAQKISRASDIVIVAIGKPKFIGLEYFRGDKTQVVVDVGINRMETGEVLQEEMPRTKLIGDVDFDEVKNMVAAISPVPGGVGPMTVACLFENLRDAFTSRGTRC